MDESKKILLYDGTCSLCNGIVAFIHKQDHKKRFQFYSLTGPEGRQHLDTLDLKKKDLDSVVLISGNQYYTKSTAALKTLYALKNGWSVFYLFMLVPRFLRDAVYDFIAANRYRLNKNKNNC
jgi:predicted DCC family thiol-disulfide oxidoreductase YuxK